MSALPKQAMTADEFITWAVKQPREAGKLELEDGHVIQMMSERLLHVDIKSKARNVLRDAIHRGKRPCFSVGDGAMVRISKSKTYGPDGLVYCGPRHPDDLVEVPNPVIIYEVLSPESAERDFGEKVPAYFSLSTVQHYLIVDPDRRVVVHYRRGMGEDIVIRFRNTGSLALDPPGIEFDLSELFERD